MSHIKSFILVLWFCVGIKAYADNHEQEPLVAHVVVALCDNIYQRIVPVPLQLGSGDHPQSNLYWGAMYGVKGFFSRQDRWQAHEVKRPLREHVLDQIAYVTAVEHEGENKTLVVFAEAWRGKNIKQSIEYYLSALAGQHPEEIELILDGVNTSIEIGSSASVLSYIGHNGLMDFELSSPSSELASSPLSITLACKSEEYFRPHFEKLNNHSLLPTTGLMAPEAYTLEAALLAWAAGESGDTIHEASSATYAKYQRAKISWARRLFLTGDNPR